MAPDTLPKMAKQPAPAATEAGTTPLGTYHRSERVKAVDQVVEILVDSIRSGAYAVRSTLPSERELAKLVGVSRRNVSRAIDVLEEHGVLEARRGASGGTFVISVEGLPHAVSRIAGDERKVMRHLLEVRAGLQLQALQLAARRCEEGDLEQLDLILEKMRTLVGSFSAFNEAASTFQIQIAAISRNPLLLEFMQRTIREMQTLRAHMSNEPSRLEAEEALRLAEAQRRAIERGDQKRLSRLAAEYVDFLRRTYLGAEEQPI